MPGVRIFYSLTKHFQCNEQPINLLVIDISRGLNAQGGGPAQSRRYANIVHVKQITGRYPAQVLLLRKHLYDI